MGKRAEASTREKRQKRASFATKLDYRERLPHSISSLNHAPYLAAGVRDFSRFRKLVPRRYLVVARAVSRIRISVTLPTNLSGAKLSYVSTYRPANKFTTRRYVVVAMQMDRNFHKTPRKRFD